MRRWQRTFDAAVHDPHWLSQEGVSLTPTPAVAVDSSSAWHAVEGRVSIGTRSEIRASCSADSWLISVCKFSDQPLASGTVATPFAADDAGSHDAYYPRTRSRT
jgi:hypothetical protein